jgi:hypothetical protein
MEVSGQLHAPAALPPEEMPRYQLDRRLGEPQSPSGRCGEEKSLAPVRIITLAVQPIARRYTDWAILTHINVLPRY